VATGIAVRSPALPFVSSPFGWSERAVKGGDESPPWFSGCEKAPASGPLFGRPTFSTGPSGSESKRRQPEMGKPVSTGQPVVATPSGAAATVPEIHDVSRTPYTSRSTRTLLQGLGPAMGSSRGVAVRTDTRNLSLSGTRPAPPATRNHFGGAGQPARRVRKPREGDRDGGIDRTSVPREQTLFNTEGRTFIESLLLAEGRQEVEELRTVREGSTLVKTP
jgi:hypothetical protein